MELENREERIKKNLISRYQMTILYNGIAAYIENEFNTKHPSFEVVRSNKEWHTDTWDTIDSMDVKYPTASSTRYPAISIRLYTLSKNSSPLISYDNRVTMTYFVLRWGTDFKTEEAFVKVKRNVDDAIRRLDDSRSPATEKNG